MSQFNDFRGFIGLSLRELNSTELILYCNESSKVKSFPLIEKKGNFTSDFMIRVYSSGCYYFDVNDGKWLSDGMEILEDTNVKQTHCISTHLTSFAGGFVILPSSINFQYVFANASFSKNLLIYLTLIILTCLYILFAIWARIMDKRDLKKLNIVPLKDNNPQNDYFYELMVFTGNQSEAATQSKV
jgi:polycystin 1L2